MEQIRSKTPGTLLTGTCLSSLFIIPRYSPECSQMRRLLVSSSPGSCSHPAAAHHRGTAANLYRWSVHTFFPEYPQFSITHVLLNAHCIFDFWKCLLLPSSNSFCFGLTMWWCVDPQRACHTFPHSQNSFNNLLSWVHLLTCFGKPLPKSDAHNLP